MSTKARCTHRRNMLLLLGALTAVLHSGPMAWADLEPSETIIVYVDKDNTSGIEDGLSWATAYSNLERAFEAIGHIPEAWVDLWIAEGVYDAQRTFWHGEENKGTLMLWRS